MRTKPKHVEDKLEFGMGDIYDDEEGLRFNEVNGSNKRRKFSNEGISEGGALFTVSSTSNTANKLSENPKKPIVKKIRRSGPFLSDSEDSESFEDNEKPPSAPEIEMKDVQDSEDSDLSDLGDLSDPGMSPAKPRLFRNTLEQPAKVTDPDKVPIVKAPQKKRVNVQEAQAKWEALQPSKRKARVEKAENSSESEYEEKKKHVAKPLVLKKSPTDTELSDNENPRKKSGVSKSWKSQKEVSRENASAGETTEKKQSLPKVPTLRNEATSVDDWGQFEDGEEFADDEFADGEEFVERKWMEEQARLEAAEQELFDEPFHGFDDELIENELTPACPICSTSLDGISSDDATRHVNGCLDGKTVPVSTPKPEVKKPKDSKGNREVKFMPSDGSKQFVRKAAIPRPGQANPIPVDGKSSSGPTTAFSHLMSNKAEDAAWANAAAAENAARGKPAYQRTCPFYKIMPGLFICVDAFRYGAVQGCNAYFLSHFHSDHYIGLTSTWCHGPIYCSKVTANLVKQQLRVNPKWVVPLEFDVKSEVPGTQGVQITMIPANHCPGSSLFLFEKSISKSGTPKVHRILHCGDFRACPEHLNHPQLMPDIVDTISGKTKQQKIDVCYLDTTYLNPRYAFPSQEDVIKACADMCVSLKKDRADEGDAWEVVKKQRAGAGMNNFVSTGIKPEDDSIAMAIGSTKSRGRLLVICGTYSIGKERICMGIARALDCKIWAPPGKMKICAVLEDPELASRLTDDPKEAQIHMQMLMEIRAETLQEYLNTYKPHFNRIVGFRPSGWNYRPPISRYVPILKFHDPMAIPRILCQFWAMLIFFRFTDSPSVSTILNSVNWQSKFSMAELVPQRGSTREASCFGVPYSEHSSFRELTMFVCALRIEKVIPTVNVGSGPGRAKMKAWIDKWLAERRKNGVIKIGNGDGEVKW